MKNSLFLNTIVVLLLFYSLILPQAFSGGQPDLPYQEVIANGRGAIINNDLAKAEDDGVASALRNAVEQVIGTMVQSDVLVQNYQTIEDRIYSQSRGYVERYEIMGKAREGEYILVVTIKALVRKGNLKDNLAALGLLITRKGKPRVMVIVDEKNMDSHYYSWTIDMNTTENEIMNDLLEKGFPFVDREAAMRKIEKDAIMATLGGDEAAAVSIATQSGAEVLIVGKAVSKVAASGPSALAQAGMLSCQATVNLRVLRADDATIIATTSQQSAAAHIDQLSGGTQALKKAAQLAAEDLSGKIVDRWQKDIYSGTTVNLRLMNVESYSDLIKVKNMLPYYVRGVQNVYQRDYSQNTALFDLDVRGTANQVAEELVMKDFSPYTIEVVNVTQNTIVARLGKQTIQEESSP
jgi:hypothetical protein